MNDTIKSTHERHTAATKELHEAIEAYRAASKAMNQAEQRLNKARDQYRRTTDEVMQGLPAHISADDIHKTFWQTPRDSDYQRLPDTGLPLRPPYTITCSQELYGPCTSAGTLGVRRP